MPNSTRAALLPQGLSAAHMQAPHVLLQVLEGVTLSEQPWMPGSATSLGFARVYKVMLHFQDPSKYPPEVGLDWQAVKRAFSRTFIGALTVSRKGRRPQHFELSICCSAISRKQPKVRPLCALQSERDLFYNRCPASLGVREMPTAAVCERKRCSRLPAEQACPPEST